MVTEPLKTVSRNRLRQRLEGLLFYLLLVIAIGLAGWLSQRYQAYSTGATGPETASAVPASSY